MGVCVQYSSLYWMHCESSWRAHRDLARHAPYSFPRRTVGKYLNTLVGALKTEKQGS